MYREAGFVLFCITYVKSQDRDFRGGRMICLKKPESFILYIYKQIIFNIICNITCTNNVLNGEYKYNQKQPIKFNSQALVIFSSILLPRFYSFGGRYGDIDWGW